MRSDWFRLVEMKPTLVAAEPVSAYDAKTHLPKLLCVSIQEAIFGSGQLTSDFKRPDGTFESSPDPRGVASM